MFEFYRRNTSFFIILIVMISFFIQHLISFRLGMNFEESRDANAYLLFLKGNLPYRDFEWIYGPLSFFIYPVIMKIFGINLIALRISYIVFVSLVIPLSFFLSRRILPPLWAGVAAFLSVILFDVPYYTFNHIFAVFGELSCLLMLCRFIEEDKKVFNLFWAGIFASIVILTKPLLAGVTLFTVVSVFLLFFNFLGPWQRRIKNYLIFFVTAVTLVLIYLLYFYSQTKLKNIDISQSSFAHNLTFLTESMKSINWKILFLFFKNFMNIFPIHNVINVSSCVDVKKIMVSSFNNFISILPFLVSILVIFVFISCRFTKVNQKIKEKVYRDKKFLLLFVIFSLCISIETLIIVYAYNRAYIIQATFILLTYLLYLLKTTYSHRPMITGVFIALFLFYLSFLHFFRYPYSMLKKYIAPLNIERAKGVLVTTEEKELYESLTAYLSLNFSKEDKMAVMGYYPQLGFLTGWKNIFEDQELIFCNLELLLSEPMGRKEKKIILLRDKIISKIKNEKPKIILTVADTSGSLAYFKSISLTIADYIEKNYSLDRVFGPADIIGRGNKMYWVKLYRYKNEDY